ncbi:MAG: hypothetical protein J0M24_00570 [Verrucomicrobia bacterium]|nr:hypothetical protein [Verrucomicrobiota bacterium]
MAILLAATAFARLLAADPVFSGPQPGEKTTGFKVVAIGGDADGKERDPIAENAGAPTALVFIHQIERSLIPLLRVIEQYGIERKDRLKTEVVFLTPDRLAGQQRVRSANGSLKLQSRVGLSPDGAEGPGNYGLNKDCLMTIVTAKDNKVVANFALVQPGIADAPNVIAALAKTCGDENPPTAEALAAKQPGYGMARGRDAAAMKKGDSKPKENFPGAVPTDEKLTGLLRQFIRPTNDDATVDRVLGEVKTYIKGDADLTQQAADGWTRVLHFGERYGTAYARKVGREFLDSLSKP